ARLTGEVLRAGAAPAPTADRWAAPRRVQVEAGRAPADRRAPIRALLDLPGAAEARAALPAEEAPAAHRAAPSKPGPRGSGSKAVAGLISGHGFLLCGEASGR